MKMVFHKGGFYFLLFLILPLLALLSACSEADTLGDESPDEVSITGDPSWENGIGQLVKKKCASCHTVPANDLTPDGTPNDLDLTAYQSSGGINRGDSLGTLIALGVLTGSVGTIRKMPLEYATPLTSSEIAALNQWVEDGLPEN